MSLVNPLALALFALAVPIALLYLIRHRPRELPVATDQFWEQVFAEQSYRMAWRRLRDVASLLVQLILLALLVMALAEPIWNSAAREARRVVIVVDRSASMSANDGSPTRLADATRAARDLIADLREVDESAVIEAASEPSVACGLTSDRRTLGRAVEQIATSEGPARLPEAVELARLLLAGHPRGQIEVFTDGCVEGIESLSKASDVALHLVGRRSGNLGITLFQVRRSFHDVAGYQMLIEVSNFSDSKVEAPLILELDGLELDVLPMSLAAGESWRGVLEKASAAGGRLTARIDRVDALSCDNLAWAILPAREPLPVTLVAGESRFDDLYLDKVLEANPLVRQPVNSISAGETASDLLPGEIRVYHRRVPARIPPGPTIVISPIDSCDLWDVGDRVQAPLVGTQDRSSPLLAFVKLDNVEIADARALGLKGKAKVLCSFINGEPLLASFDRPEGKVLVLAASLDDPADLPLRTAFPILMGNALTWLDGRREELRESAQAGSVVELAGVASGSKLWSPQGRERPCASDGDRLTVGPLDRCGVWRVASVVDGPAFAEVACNLASPRESDIRPSKGVVATPKIRAVPGGPWFRTPWFALIVAAFLLAILEWRLYQRRWLD